MHGCFDGIGVSRTDETGPRHIGPWGPEAPEHRPKRKRAERIREDTPAYYATLPRKRSGSRSSRGLRTPFAKQGSAYRDVSALDSREDRDERAARPLRARPARNRARSSSGRWCRRSPRRTSRASRSRDGDAEIDRSVQRQAGRARRRFGDHERGRVDARGAARGRRSAGGADSASDVPITVSKRLAARSSTRAKPSRSGQAPRVLEPEPERLPPRSPRAQRADDGPLDGGERREDGEGGGHPPRRAGRVRHRSQRAPARRGSRASSRAKSCTSCRRRRSTRRSREDNMVRKASTLDAYARLSPAFDRKYGTITAGNSSPLTDGAAAVVLMTESKAKALGYKPLGYLRSWAYAAARSGRLDADGAELRDADRARPRRDRAEGSRRHRHARGVRGAGPLQREGVRFEAVRRREARPRERDRRDRRREAGMFTAARSRSVTRSRRPVRG